MNWKEMSDLDKKILEQLQNNGRKSYTELAEMFNANVSTVSNRVQKLIDNDILKIVGVVNPFKTGRAFVVDLEIKIKPQNLQSVISQLKEIEEVRFLATKTGSFNLLAELYTSTSNDLQYLLNEKVNKIDEIEEYKTSVILEVHKQSYNFRINSD